MLGHCIDHSRCTGLKKNRWEEIGIKGRKDFMMSEVFLWFKKISFYLLCIMLLAHSLYATQIVDGVSYSHCSMDESIPQSIHLLTIDPSKVIIELVKAGSTGIGADKVSVVAQQEKAIAAINGGFCKGGGELYGIASGILKIKDTWFTDAQSKEITRGALGWDSAIQALHIDWVSTECKLCCAQEEIVISSLNRERDSSDIILYTPAFAESTMTSDDGTEIIVKDGIVTDIVQQGNTSIPKDGFIISIGKQYGPCPSFIKIGMAVWVTYSCIIPQGLSSTESKAWSDFHFIVGGIPVLVVDGHEVTSFDRERISRTFIEERHARTAVGMLPNGDWLFAVVDGYEEGVAEGMTLQALAAFMVRQGCIKALNLSGGASSILWLAGDVKNNPGKSVFGFKFYIEKDVSDVIVIKPKIAIHNK